MVVKKGSIRPSSPNRVLGKPAIPPTFINKHPSTHIDFQEFKQCVRAMSVHKLQDGLGLLCRPVVDPQREALRVHDRLPPPSGAQVRRGVDLVVHRLRDTPAIDLQIRAVPLEAVHRARFGIGARELYGGREGHRVDPDGPQ